MKGDIHNYEASVVKKIDDQKPLVFISRKMYVYIFTVRKKYQIA